jgi:hypothetical protein
VGVLMRVETKQLVAIYTTGKKTVRVYARRD